MSAPRETGDTAEQAAKPARPPAPPAPRSIRIALGAVGVQLAGAVASAIATLVLTGALRDYIRHVNAHAKAKDRKVLCGTPRVKDCLDIHAYVHNLQIATAISTVVIASLLGFSAWKFRRGSRTGRSTYVLLSIVGAFVAFTGSPLALLSFTAGGPESRNVLSSIAAAGSVVAIVTLFRPDSSQFFNEHSPKPGRSDMARPSMLSMFSMKPAATANRSSVSLEKTGSVDPSPSFTRGKAKRRTEADAVARGAELARARAKANKSRRTES